jgi:hypothetical protein
MSVTVGLDLGTHQTKVCLRDESNTGQKTFEFFKFNDVPLGESELLLPSIVQINDDDTLSYGFVDKDKCKREGVTEFLEPEPKLVLPEKPLLRSVPAALPYNASVKDKIRYNKKLREVSVHNDYVMGVWDTECAQKRMVFEESHKVWSSKYVECLNNVENLHYRYFKIACYSKCTWKHKIEPEIITVWYLGFVLLNIRERYGREVFETSIFTQMGVPYSFDSTESRRHVQMGYNLLLAANKLIENFGSLTEYTSVRFHELFALTKLHECSDDDKNNYGLNILPEAYAGLKSITESGRLGNGMNLLVDIGGGTTDISFFTIKETTREPNIHAVISFPKGLNFIFEDYQRKCSDNISVMEIQDIFRLNEQGFSESISNYQMSLKEFVGDMLTKIRESFNARRNFHRIPTHRLIDAMKNRPVVFSGGGSIYGNMRKPMTYFSDIKLINRQMLNILNLKNENIPDSIYPILSTAFGLSIQIEGNLEMTPIEEVFNQLGTNDDASTYYDHSNDYGIADT